MLLKAAGVRSTMRLEPHVVPQQWVTWQNRLVWGPQSTMVTPTARPLQRLVTVNRWPQGKRAGWTPQAPGSSNARQAGEMFGQAQPWMVFWHVPQAPVVFGVGQLLPDGFPQQNQVASPEAPPGGFLAMVADLRIKTRGAVDQAHGTSACRGRPWRTAP